MSRRLVGTVLLGTLLNPLNSSMIAVALVRLHDDFAVSLATVSWLVSAFYLAAAVGQALMGRVADLLGPRRVFCAGWVVVAATGALAPLAPSFGWLVAARVLLAIGTSGAFPAGLALIRRGARDPDAPPPAAALGAVAVAASVSAALGPVLGGVLVGAAGWQAIFLVNTALALVGLPLALAVLPRDPAPAAAGRLLEVVDVPGIVLFTGLLTGVLGFVLSLGSGPRWWLLPPAAACAAGLVVAERRAVTPIVDLEVAGNRAIAAVLAQFAGVSVVFYSAFFALPQWLEEARGLTPQAAGLLLLPVAGLGVLVTPLAARSISRSGPRPSLIAGSVALTAGAALMLTLGPASGTAAILAVSIVLGIPNGFNNLGLQAALYERTPAVRTGAAGGLFQTGRYVGAIFATALIGAAYGDGASTHGLHVIALVTTGVAAVLVAASVATSRRAVSAPT